MNKLTLKEIIKEEIFNILKEENKKEETNMPSNIKAIKKDLDDQGNNFKQIGSLNKMVKALDLIVNNVKKENPKFAESDTFKQAIRAFAKKHK